MTCFAAYSFFQRQHFALLYFLCDKRNLALFPAVGGPFIGWKSWDTWVGR